MLDPAPIEHAQHELLQPPYRPASLPQMALAQSLQSQLSDSPIMGHSILSTGIDSPYGQRLLRQRLVQRGPGSRPTTLATVVAADHVPCRQ